MARLRKRLEKERDRERQTTLVEDLDTLRCLEVALQAITPEQFSKYRLLCRQLSDGVSWTPADPEDRLVVFTESLATLEFLAGHLPGDLGLGQDQTAVLRGDQRDKDLMDTVEAFNRRESPIRLLLCSDVAAEGINLHHFSHRLVHFDIPWSLMVFQQRNGRIDRYGQTRRPQIRYLLTESNHAKVHGDQRILEVLIAKDEQARKNIGDPSEFLGLYDPRAEEEKIAAVIEQEDDGNDLWRQFEALMERQANEAASPLINFIPEAGPARGTEAVCPLPGIFPNGLEYARAALRWFAEKGEKLDGGIENQTFWLTAPVDLQQRLSYLPKEARPEHDHFTLTPDKARISAEIRRARQEEDTAWPTLHYLWPLHPVMEWLSDRALNAFGRHTAPVIQLPDKLAGDEHIILIHGGFPNRRGHVLIQDWVGVRLRGERVVEQLDWAALASRLDLRPGKLANRGQVGDTAALRALLPAAVDAARLRLKALKAGFEAERKDSLDAQRQRLAKLKGRHETQLCLELERSDAPEAFKARRRDERQHHIDRVFRDYADWLENTQTTENDPHLQVAAVFTGQSAKERG
ncbi:MAG: SWF/SNF helicase family protein [Nitrococcus sp.]|nr:SWF/SNF helicase family protein [Nitrococcus sp.]